MLICGLKEREMPVLDGLPTSFHPATDLEISPSTSLNTGVPVGPDLIGWRVGCRGLIYLADTSRLDISSQDRKT